MGDVKGVSVMRKKQEPRKPKPRGPEVQKMAGDLMHSMARLNDRNPAELAVIETAAREHFEKTRLKRSRALAFGRGQTVAMEALAKEIGPATIEILRNANVRAALGRLSVDYGNLPSTLDSRLLKRRKKGPEPRSIGAAAALPAVPAVLLAPVGPAALVAAGVVLVLWYLYLTDDDEVYAP